MTAAERIKKMKGMRKVKKKLRISRRYKMALLAKRALSCCANVCPFVSCASATLIFSCKSEAKGQYIILFYNFVNAFT